MNNFESSIKRQNDDQVIIPLSQGTVLIVFDNNLMNLAGGFNYKLLIDTAGTYNNFFFYDYENTFEQHWREIVRTLGNEKLLPDFHKINVSQKYTLLSNYDENIPDNILNKLLDDLKTEMLLIYSQGKSIVINDDMRTSHKYDFKYAFTMKCIFRGLSQIRKMRESTLDTNKVFPIVFSIAPFTEFDNISELLMEMRITKMPLFCIVRGTDMNIEAETSASFRNAIFGNIGSIFITEGLAKLRDPLKKHILEYFWHDTTFESINNDAFGFCLADRSKKQTGLANVKDFLVIPKHKI